MIILVIVGFALLLLPDLTKLLREGDKRQLAVYAVIGAIALFCAVRYAMGKSVFSLIQEAILFTRDTLGLNYKLWR